jgi:hypothetical protein
MNDEEIILRVFVCIDDLIGKVPLDLQPGPDGNLCLSEVLTLMVLHPLLKPGVSLKQFYRWVKSNLLALFPGLVEYSRLTRLFSQAQEFLVVVLQRLANLSSFGLVADGTTVAVMQAVRGPHAQSFRNARKVYCKSKYQWDWGFLLELVIDQAGQIAFFSLGAQAEVKQLESILDDLADRWVLGDRGNRSKTLENRLWQEKRIRLKITGGKERQWIENVIGTLKAKLGLDRIRVRKTPAFLARLKAILCAHNLANALHLPI